MNKDTISTSSDTLVKFNPNVNEETARQNDYNVEEVIQNHIEATGIAKFMPVTTIKMNGKVKYMKTYYPFNVYFKLPDKYRVDVNIKGKFNITSYTGNKGWSSRYNEPDSIYDLYNEALLHYKIGATSGTLTIDLLNKHFKSVEADGMIVWENINNYKIKLVSKEGYIYYLYINPSSYLCSKVYIVVESENGPDEFEKIYYNYKNFHGYEYPNNVETIMNGLTINNVVVEDITYNEKMNDSIFYRPKDRPISFQQPEDML